MQLRTLFAAGVLTAALLPSFGAAAQTPTAPAHPPTTPPARTHMMRTANSVHGVVKGAPTGNTFVVARRGGTVTVDATGATIRSRTQTGTIDMIKPGTIVTAKGSMQSGVFKATEVIAYPRASKIIKKKTTTTTTVTPTHP